MPQVAVAEREANGRVTSRIIVLSCPECGEMQGPNPHVHHKSFCPLELVTDPEDLVAAIREREAERILEIEHRREEHYQALTSSLARQQSFACRGCGAVVLDRDLHTEFHLKNEETERKLERLMGRQ